MKTENIKLSDFNKKTYTNECICDLIDKSNGSRLYGELGHPDTFDVSISNISHIVTNLEIYEDGIYGDIKILDTQSGKLYKKLMNNDIECSVSERSVGVLENGIVTVKKIFSYDLIVTEEIKLKLRKLKIEKILRNINDKRG